MQENCLFGSEGGAKLSFVPTPIYGVCQATDQRRQWFFIFCRATKLPLFSELKGPEQIDHFEHVSSWSSLSVARLDKAASYSACQV